MHVKNRFVEMNNLNIIIGGHVIHSYGRLVHYHHVITRDQLLPPGNETAPGRMDCIITAPETAHFEFGGGEPPTSFVSRIDDDDDQMDTLFFNRSHLSINTEGICQGANTYFFLCLIPGTTNTRYNLQYAKFNIQSLQLQHQVIIILMLYYCFNTP